MRNKKAEAGFVTVIMALVFIGIIFTFIATSTSSTHTSESYTGLVDVNETLTHDDLEALNSVSNGTVTLATTEYTTYLSDGEITLLNTSHNGTTLTANYNYYSAGYVKSGTTRMVLLLIPIIFGAGILFLVTKT